MPDGSQRVPVNSPQSIERYRSPPPGRGQVPADGATAQRLAQLEAELAALREQLALSAMAAPATTPGMLRLDGAELSLRGDSMLLRFPQALGRAHCALRPSVRALLLSAALQSGRIEIRGRTDAERGDLFNQRLAERRASCMHRLLMAAGVPVTKLHASALAAGDFVADNGSPAARARNRRVEVELLALDPVAARALVTQATRSTP
jgi:flagellar motor protein MotB